LNARLRGLNLESFMRRLSDSLVAALPPETERTEALSDDKIDAYERSISVARHYGWTTAMSLVADRDGGVTTVGLDLDVLLWPQRALQSVTNAAAKPLPGGGLVADAWSGK
jgi:hypothetical protein